MYPNPIQRLIDLFAKFPGIGPRQATRFVFSLLKSELSRELAAALNGLEAIGLCTQCFRTMEKAELDVCGLCRNLKRDPAVIAVVEKEADMHNIEKTGSHQGTYHVLGGLISPLNSDSTKGLHLRELHDRVRKTLERHKKCEVILATGATTEGDTTALYIERILAPLKDQYVGLAISRLGRGLSLGSELEYADEVTLKNALTNRK